jgi:hypothetical protein
LTSQNSKIIFWKDVLLWEKVIEKERNIKWHFFLATPVWFNNKIMIDNKSIFYKEWFETISLLGFGKERKRWLKSGRIIFTTVILPMTVGLPIFCL